MRRDSFSLRPELSEEYARAGYWREETTIDMLERAVAAGPDKIALVDARRRLSYAEYGAEVARLAAEFVRLGLTRDDVIAIQLPNRVEFAIAVNAAAMADVPFCQFHVGLRAAEVEFILRFSEAKAVIVPRTWKGFDHVGMVQKMSARLEALEHVLVVGDTVPDGCTDVRAVLEHGATASATEMAARRPAANDLMRVAFTSGTTGDPKAVLHTFNTSLASKRQNVIDEHISAESVFLVFVPVGLNLGFGEILLGLLAGCRVVLMDKFEPAAVLETIEREGVTHLSSAPAGLHSLLAEPGFDDRDLSSLVMVLVGGAPCSLSLLREWQERAPGRLIEKYGMLEIGTGASTLFTHDPESVNGTVGTTPPEITLRTVDDHLVDVPAGHSGEVVARGAAVTPGYYNNPSANARAVTPDGWFRTGDIGRFDDNGYLTIVGRKKEMVIRGGANIYPSELEDILLSCPGVKDVAVGGVPDARLGETVGVYVVPTPHSTVRLEDVIEHLHGKIAQYKMPQHLFVVEEIPRTPTGKIQRWLLSEHEKNGAQ